MERVSNAPALEDEKGRQKAILNSKKAIDLFKKYDIMYFVRIGDDGFFHGNKLPYTVVY